MTTTPRPFELAWIPPGTAAANPNQYVEHPDHQLDALVQNIEAAKSWFLQR